MLSSIQLRSFHTARTAWKKASAEGRFMMKLMTGSSKSKKAWHPDFHSGPSSVPEVYGVPRKGNTKVSARRLAVLADIFTEKITDLMVTGPLSGELCGKGFSITQVKVTPDAARVNIYWTASEIIPQMQLTQLSGKLRHELTQLRVCGNVPMIDFVMDRQQLRADYVDQLLKSAIVRSSFKSQTETDQVKEDVSEDVPKISHDILGLNRHLIIQKIVQAKNKAEGRCAQRLLTNSEKTFDNERAINFSKFLTQQKKQYSKMKGRDRSPIVLDQPEILSHEDEEEWSEEDYVEEDAR